MNKKYYFIAGLPRSGSTLLCNLLAQNPNFHTTATSGIMDIMFGVRNQWDNLLEFKANPDELAKIRVLRSILDGFYSTIEKPIIFDKCRGWLSLLEMAEAVLGQKAKVLVPVRDIRDVLASFEKLWRANAGTSQFVSEGENYFQFQTTQGRSEFWLRHDQPVGLALNRIRDALNRGFADRMYFVEFERLTTNPHQIIKEIYDFLEEPLFEHDVHHIEQVTFEDDSVHGFKNLHTIRNKIEPVQSDWQQVLGLFAQPYAQLNIWKNKLN